MDPREKSVSNNRAAIAAWMMMLTGRGSSFIKVIFWTVAAAASLGLLCAQCCPALRRLPHVQVRISRFRESGRPALAVLNGLSHLILSEHHQRNKKGDKKNDEKKQASCSYRYIVPTYT